MGHREGGRTLVHREEGAHWSTVRGGAHGSTVQSGVYARPAHSGWRDPHPYVTDQHAVAVHSKGQAAHTSAGEGLRQEHESKSRSF